MSILFELFENTVNKYPAKLALNNFTYHQLYKLIKERNYTSVCNQTDWTIVLDILKASSLDKEIKIMPKFKRENVILNLDVKDEFGITLFSSGSTGSRKEIFLSDKMIAANVIAAVKSQELIHDDVVLTVCSLNHTGGINAQTLPALVTGCHVVIEAFNPYTFYKQLTNHNVTVTHLIPAMIESLGKIKTKSIKNSLRLVAAGSDCVYKHHVNHWLKLNTKFMINYGMTEAGPIIINHVFSPGDDLSIFESGFPLGSKTWCETKIDNGELLLNGDNIFVPDWFNTGDCVYLKDNWFMYKGRKSAGCKIIPKSY